jgi:type II secretory pathway pseudopilin PulG
MQSKGFTLVELVTLALVIGIITLIALPTFTAPLPNLRASKNQAYVASTQADLTRLVGAEEDYSRDSLKYTSTVVCATPPAPGVLNFCPSRGNLLGTPRLGFSARGRAGAGARTIRRVRFSEEGAARAERRVGIGRRGSARRCAAACQPRRLFQQGLQPFKLAGTQHRQLLDLRCERAGAARARGREPLLERH